MRLRKNLKLLAALHCPANDVASSSTSSQPHPPPPAVNLNHKVHNHNHNASSSSSPPSPPRLVCQLNRSVWDVDKPSQLEGGEYSLSGTVGSSISATLNSVSKTLVDDDGVAALHRPPPRKNNKGKNYREKKVDGDAVIPARCTKGDGRGWCCKKEAKRGHTLCEHHSYPRSSSNHHRRRNNDNGGISCNGNNVAPSRLSQPGIKLSDDKPEPSPPPPPHPPAKAVRRGGRVAKKSSGFSSNPYEFYYYSGFGPKWGKRRGGGGRSAAENNAAEVGKDAVMSSEASLSSMDNSGENNGRQPGNENGSGYKGGVIEFIMDDYDFDDDDEDEEVVRNGKGKKRGRKMVKARSLKSLM